MEDKVKEIAIQIYKFAHRGKTPMTWDELPYKWGKKAYLNFAEEISQLFEPKGERPSILTEADIANLGIYTGYELPVYLCIAEAQRDSDAQWYEAKMKELCANCEAGTLNQLKIEQAKAEVAREIFNTISKQAWYRDVDVGMGKHRRRVANCLCFTFNEFDALKAKYGVKK